MFFFIVLAPVVKMNNQFINVSREVVGERLSPIGVGRHTHKCPLPATYRSFDDNALNVYEL